MTTPEVAVTIPDEICTVPSVDIPEIDSAVPTSESPEIAPPTNSP